MGLGDFFSPKESELEVIPKTPAQKQGTQVLRRLIGSTPTIPTRDIAGMSGIEQAGMDQLAKFVSGGAYQDPRYGPAYESFRAESRAEENRGADVMRRRAQLGGALGSSSAGRAEGLMRADMSTRRLGVLGQMLQQERARDNPLTRAMAASEYGGLGRLLEQAGMDSEFQAALKQIMFPYQMQAPIAQSLMSHQQPMYATQPQRSGFAEVLDPFGVASIFAGAAAQAALV